MLLKWTALCNLTKTPQIRIIEQTNNLRLFVTSCVVNGRKARDPYDRRFGIRPSDAGPHKPGGSKELAQKLGRQIYRKSKFVRSKKAKSYLTGRKIGMIIHN